MPTAEPWLWPWQGVKWNLAFIGFCAYSIAIITYIAPIGEAGMIVALIGIAFGSQRVRFPLPLILFGAYYVYSVLTWPSSVYVPLVRTELESMGKVGLIFLVGINVLMERTRFRFYLFMYLAAFGLYPVRGAIFNQFIYHSAELGRIAWNETFANPNDLATLLLFPLGLAAGMMYTERHKYLRLASLAGVVLISMIVFLTQSRGGILSLGIFGLVVLARQKRRLRMLPYLALVAVAIVMFAPEGVWTRMKNLGSATSSGHLREADDKGSAEQRFEIWKVATTIISRDPITGVGLGAYTYAHWRLARNSSEAFNPTARGGRDAHSTYLTVLAETGVPGFVFFMGIFLSVYIYAQGVRAKIKQSDPDGERQIFFAQAALIALAIAAVFSSWAHMPFTYMSVAIMYAMCWVLMQKQRAREAAARQAVRFR
jgi:O-antigen ligase